MSRDFTFKKYKELCCAVKASGYSVMTVAEYLEQMDGVGVSKSVVMRHDVDRCPRAALDMARMEAELGISSTYYFRTTAKVYSVALLKEVSALRHEIGYHYETLSRKKGDLKRAYELFQMELAQFRDVCDIKTICMHGSPLSKWDNRDLWKTYDFADDGILGEPYISIDYSNISYLTDTGRCWDGDKHNVRDRVKEGKSLGLESTDDVIAFLETNDRPVLLQTHPERWPATKIGYCRSLCFDRAVNCVKSLLLAVGG